MSNKIQKRSATEVEQIGREIYEIVRREVDERVGKDGTFEERQDAALEIMRDVLRRHEENDLRERTTHDEEIEIEGKRYQRLKQPSSATYYGRWGSYQIEESLYREVGVRNGPTVKPLEHQVGMVARHMTPNLARVVGLLSAVMSSREVEATMVAFGLKPPKRAFLDKRFRLMGTEIADEIAAIEDEVRANEPLPEGIAAVSCGMDRFTVRMSEPAERDADATSVRSRPYVRTPPPPKEYRYRKAWAGSVTAYNADGEALKTWRYATEAEADPSLLADRIVREVARVLKANPSIPVHCIQDAAPELRILLVALRRALSSQTQLVELIDFEHLMGYLDKVVDACEPQGDPHRYRDWHRHLLLTHDNAIDRILRRLRRLAKLHHTKAAQDALTAAISYIWRRKNLMRYASFYAANLPIGGGATENACFVMQKRVKQSGQSWEVPGLRSVLTVRALVTSERWDHAWPIIATARRREIQPVA